MKKTTLALSALALSLGLALSPLSATAAETPSAVIARQMPSLTPVFEKVMPSVVSVNVESSIAVSTPCVPRNFQQFFDDDSPFCQEGSLFQSSPFCQGGQGGSGGSQQWKLTALGSSVIIDVDKDCVVTNNHVADNVTVIRVQLGDGRKFNTKMIDRDSRSDITLVQVRNPKNLIVVKMTDSDTLRMGDYTVTIGNPFGLGETVISGTVFMLGHNGLSTEDHGNFIQTGVVTNRGNSDGVLVNLNGELTGIDTMVLAPDGGNIDTDFAIPSNMVKNLASQTVEHGQVKRGKLGIMGIELNPELAKAMKVDAQHGAFVSQVLPNSSVTKAGIKTDDMITSLNSKSIGSFAVLRVQVGTTSVDNKLTLGLLHDGKQVSVNLELQQSSQNQADPNSIFNDIEGVETNSKGKDQGVVVNDVKMDVPAARIDLEKGDVIIGTNQQVVKNIVELRKVLNSKPPVLALSTQRGDSIVCLLVQ